MFLEILSVSITLIKEPIYFNRNLNLSNIYLYFMYKILNINIKNNIDINITYLICLKTLLISSNILVDIGKFDFVSIKNISKEGST